MRRILLQLGPEMSWSKVQFQATTNERATIIRPDYRFVLVYEFCNMNCWTTRGCSTIDLQTFSSSLGARENNEGSRANFDLTYP